MDLQNFTVKKKKYVSIQYDLPSQIKLREWCLTNNFDLKTKFDKSQQDVEQFDFHTTIFWSDTEHNIKNRTVKLRAEDHMAHITGMKYLGLENDIPVFTVESQSILVFRRIFEQVYGMKDKWPNYIPHITASYNGKGSTLIDSILKLPDFPLYYDRLIIDDAKEI